MNKLWGLNLEYEEHPECSAECGDGKEEGNSKPKSHSQWDSRKKGDRMDFWNQVDQDLEGTVSWDQFKSLSDPPLSAQ